MGWLGWTEDETLDTSIAAIELALNGRDKMLRACFGSSDAEEGDGERTLTVEETKTLFRQHLSTKRR